MAETVRDIMNGKLLYIRDGERLSLARGHMQRFGVTAVPILDETHRPVGVVSLRDLEGSDDENVLRSPPGAIVHTIHDADSVEDAARKLAETHLHHLVVVDAVGVAVGMVSTLDVLRAMLGMEPYRPKAFDTF